MQDTIVNYYLVVGGRTYEHFSPQETKVPVAKGDFHLPNSDWTKTDVMGSAGVV